MSRIRDFVKSLVLRTACIGEYRFAHIQTVGFFACNHQQRLVDQFHIGVGIKGDSILQARHGAVGLRIWVEMGVAVIFQALTV